MCTELCVIIKIFKYELLKDSWLFSHFELGFVVFLLLLLCFSNPSFVFRVLTYYRPRCNTRTLLLTQTVSVFNRLLFCEQMGKCRNRREGDSCASFSFGGHVIEQQSYPTEARSVDEQADVENEIQSFFFSPGGRK